MADIPMLPREAVDAVLQAIASDLYSARELLVNAGEITREMAGALAIIEKAGSLADEAVQAYGGMGVATGGEWIHGDKSIAALAALKACMR